MLNAEYKKEALAECERAGRGYEKKYKETISNVTELHSYKEAAIEILRFVDDYIHSLSNKPEELQKAASAIAIRRKTFENEINNLKIESSKNEKISKNVAGAGIVAGAGVAAFGPTAAMSIATTFGTASTGTAIATLSGAAADKAALAWLGGGALSAGGRGIAAGQALLKLAAPVGWAIGGAALLGGGLMANSKNKKIAEQAEQQAREIKKETDGINRINVKVCAEIKAIIPLNVGVQRTLNFMLNINDRDYKKFSSSEKDTLMQLMNSSNSLSKRIGVKIS